METAAALFLRRSLYEQVANRASQNHPEVHRKALAAQVSASVIFSGVLSGTSRSRMKSCRWQQDTETGMAGSAYQSSQDTDTLCTDEGTVSSFVGCYSWLVSRAGCEHARGPASVFATWAVRFRCKLWFSTRGANEVPKAGIRMHDSGQGSLLSSEPPYGGTISLLCHLNINVSSKNLVWNSPTPASSELYSSCPLTALGQELHHWWSLMRNKTCTKHC